MPCSYPFLARLTASLLVVVAVAAAAASPTGETTKGPPITYWKSNTTNPCFATPKWYPHSSSSSGKAVDLAGRVAVVTGASRGVGAAVAAALTAAGVTVLGTSRTPSTYPGLPCDLLELDVTSAASVAAFAAAVTAHPTVVRRGGLDILINNAGRLVLGGPLLPSPSDAAAWETALWEGLQTNYFGAARVTVALWPLLAARAKKADTVGGKRYGRILFTLSPLAWAAGSRGGPDMRFLFGYTATQRALAGYANNLRAGATTVGSPVKISTLSLMRTATAWADGAAPIYLPQPAGGDQAFDAFLADLRADTATGMDPSGPVAAAFLDLLGEEAPTANVAVGGEGAGLTDSVAPQGEPFSDVLTEEMEFDAAFVAVPALKPAAAIMTTGLKQGRRRRLAATLIDDALRWKATDTVPCTPLPFFYPLPSPPPPAFSLAGRVMVVTGSSSGMGRALAIQLTTAGVTVLGTSRTPAAYPGLPFELFTLDMSSPASVAAFAAAVTSHPAVVARGGLDAAILNGGRFALGPPGPPPLLDEGAWFAGMEAAQNSNFLGQARAAHAMLPLLESRLATSAGAADAYGARLLFTASASAYAVGGADPLSMYYWAYGASKRALLAFVFSVRAALSEAGSRIRVSVVEPMAVNTRLMEGLRPHFLAPVDANGWPVGDPLFKAVLWLYRDGLSRALAPGFVAGAHEQLLVGADPPPDVVGGGWDAQPTDAGRVGGQQDVWDIISQAEGLMAAFPFESGKRLWR